MPYINQAHRDCLADGDPPVNSGELNYCITKLVNDYIQRTGGLNYQNINTVVGALECAKLELYRRIAAPYEDRKREENGDVYT